MKKQEEAAFLAKRIGIEAGELLECFQWEEQTFDVVQVKKELADIRQCCDRFESLLK